MKHFLPWKHSGGRGCAKAAFFKKLGGGGTSHPLKRREDVLECCINIGCASWVEGSWSQHNKPDIPSPPDHKQDLAALAGASLSYLHGLKCYKEADLALLVPGYRVGCVSELLSPTLCSGLENKSADAVWRANP
ncbi:hypothetical protein KIL84_004380 [Mauremys mutica]|uniref:Uncharacterized protein n=1 Tax=Mauremys mutica TaxID=74926 RepID=A0A9D3XP92_9SAUR|nr:hypothetical protein KIL84_004380 [Mauremys mutica]